jgi:hypothetical protein
VPSGDDKIKPLPSVTSSISPLDVIFAFSVGEPEESPRVAKLKLCADPNVFSVTKFISDRTEFGPEPL